MTSGPFGAPSRGHPIRKVANERPRFPGTIGGISDALHGSRRAQFFAELLQAQQGPELDAVMFAWWGM
ncbi:hypothetical protein ACQP25_41550 [Microtetraspora malaysiensis]|uniref:hypothetical protein n=1 Tax=Microtetraspora malaysiensis TaxID=161358 RepID=UPI003D8BAC05